MNDCLNEIVRIELRRWTKKSETNETLSERKTIIL